MFGLLLTLSSTTRSLAPFSFTAAIFRDQEFLVSQFYVLRCHALLSGPSFSRPVFSAANGNILDCPMASVPTSQFLQFDISHSSYSSRIWRPIQWRRDGDSAQGPGNSGDRPQLSVNFSDLIYIGSSFHFDVRNGDVRGGAASVDCGAASKS